MFDAGRLELAKDVFHARTFKLKYAVGQTGREKLVRFFVIERNRVHIQVETFVLLQHFQRIVDDR